LATAADLLRWVGAADWKAGLDVVVAAPNFNLGMRREDEGAARNAVFSELGSAQREGKEVAELLGVTPLLGSRALKTLVREFRAPRILHVATHGFFFGVLGREMEASYAAGLKPPPLGDRLRRIASGSFGFARQSGLALAGANTWLSHGEPPPEAENGLLTAADIAGLDLTGTELVVLSACDTGLGHVDRPEAVVGLRGAITAAGARTIITSLWKVPDRETRALMLEFYRQLLAGAGRSEALRLAQLAIKGARPPPRYWGAFICQGDPAPLRAAAKPGFPA
jgi:CHAT domain-containing protein